MSQLRHRVAGPQQTSARSSRTPVVTCRASVKPADQARPMELLQRAALGLATAATVTLSAFAPISVGPMATPPAHAKLTSSDGIKNAQTILRYALPIENKPMREIQKDLESISDSLRIPGSKNLGPVERAVRNAIGTLQQNRKQIIADFAPDKKDDGLAALEKLTVSLDEFAKLIDGKDKQEVPIKQREALMYAGEVEEAMVKGFPFAIPKEYQDRPLLLGRATLEMKVRINETPEGPQESVLTIVLDGYNAPVSAGQFADLVNKKFYDGMEIQRADGFVVQTGDPDGPEEGYVDPKTGQVRRVPFEVRVAGDKEIIYEDTLEDLGRYNDSPALPFNAYGTLAMARSEFENNSASSQVFFLLKESELTPTGANLLDGRYAVFGYVVQGQENLGFLRVGDKIEYIKVLRGEDNLKNA